MKNIKVAKELVRIAKSLVDQSNIANKPGKYENFTGTIDWGNGKVKGEVSGANFELISSRKYKSASYINVVTLIKWHSGTWENGDFAFGIWENGAWKNGNFNGLWLDGTWENGSFTGTWKGGTWKNGIFCGGCWEDGIWEDGTFLLFGIWENGTWKNGTWKGGRWKNGTWQDGTWEDGIWEHGRMNSAIDKYGNPHNENPNEW